MHVAPQEKDVVVIVDTKGSRAVRNRDNVLALYELMTNQKKIERGDGEVMASGLHPARPLIAEQIHRTGSAFRHGHAGA
jgi:hypothetical protein